MEPSRKRLIAGAAIAAGAILIFLAGYLPGVWRAGRAAEESRLCADHAKEVQATLDQTQFNLDVALLRGRLGDVLHEANLNNFGKAAELERRFSTVCARQPPAHDCRPSRSVGTCSKRSWPAGTKSRPISHAPVKASRTNWRTCTCSSAPPSPSSSKRPRFERR